MEDVLEVWEVVFFELDDVFDYWEMRWVWWEFVGRGEEDEFDEDERDDGEEDDCDDFYCCLCLKWEIKEGKGSYYFYNLEE